jgi:hypothetical protein
MTGVGLPVPVPDSPPDRLAKGRSDEAAQPRTPLRRHLSSGTAAVAMICAPVAAVFIFRAIHAAEQHRWGSLAGLAWAALCFLGLPALGEGGHLELGTPGS